MPADRPTLEQILEHPWMKKCDPINIEKCINGRTLLTDSKVLKGVSMSSQESI